MTLALLSTHAARDTWRMRASIVIDLIVGVATVPFYVFCMVYLNAFLGSVVGPMFPVRERHVSWELMLLETAVSVALSGAAVVPLVYLAMRGQTPGLAVAQLSWRDGARRVARRRLLGEPQFWCAALPALYVFLAMLSSVPWYLAEMGIIGPAIPDAVGAMTSPTLVVGVLAIITIMLLSRKRPGRLVSPASGIRRRNSDVAPLRA